MDPVPTRLSVHFQIIMMVEIESFSRENHGRVKKSLIIKNLAYLLSNLYNQRHASLRAVAHVHEKTPSFAYQSTVVATDLPVDSAAILLIGSVA